MRILIAGQAKTGTTALLSKIKNSLDDPRVLFEPKRYEPDSSRTWSFEIAKILLSHYHGVDYNSFEPFEKKIIIVRDPRDRLISLILYSVRHSKFYNNKVKLNKFVSLLKEKEANPKSVPVSQVIALHDELNQKPSGTLLQTFMEEEKFTLDFHSRHLEYFVVRYEDFVDGKTEALANYVGFSLSGDAIVDPHVTRVVRTKGYGSWKHWFTASDCEEFKTIMENYLDRYSYSLDWELAEKPVINAAHSSEYVIRLANEKIKEDERALESPTKTKFTSSIKSYLKWRLNKLLGHL